MINTSLWAKTIVDSDNNTTFYPLIAHLLDTTVVADFLFKKWLRSGLKQLIEDDLGSTASAQFCLAAGLHDLGKASPYFQHQPSKRGKDWDFIRSALTENGFNTSTDAQNKTSNADFRHEYFSVIALGKDIKTKDLVVDNWLELVWVAHHGQFSVISTNKTAQKKAKKAYSFFQDSLWGHSHQEIIKTIEHVTNCTRENLSESISPTVLILLSGLLVLADRIASQQPWVEYGVNLLKNQPNLLEKPDEWCRIRKENVAKLVESTVGLYQPFADYKSARHAILGNNSPRPAQQAAEHAGDGVWSVMAATGSGKTEAALLRHIHRNERLLFLLPTQATTTAMMRRIHKVFSETKNVAALAHGLAVTDEFYSQPITTFRDTTDEHYNDQGGLYPTEFVRTGASRLLAPICVGTIDQALISALPTKFNHLRLLALANAHIVVDEVHTMEHYQTELMAQLMTWFAATKTPVTFLTATLPAWQHKRLYQAYQGKSPALPPKFPAVESWHPEKSSTQIDLPANVEKLTLDIDATDDLVESHIRWVNQMRVLYPQARIAIICNTVARAQEVASHLGTDTIIIHSRMTAVHRNDAASKLHELAGPGSTSTGLTVVGTQAIEASLDFDVDLMRIEICPAANLIQRAGRLWRRIDPNRLERLSDNNERTLSIAIPSDLGKGNSLPYNQAHLARTADWLQKHSALNLPGDIQEFIDTTTLSIEDMLTQSDDPSEIELDEAAYAIERIRTARDALIKFADVLDHDVEVADFSQITKKDKSNTKTTRLIEQPTIPVILCDPTGTIPGAWKGHSSDLTALSTRSDIRKALGGSLSISYALAEKAHPIPISAGNLLSRYHAIDNAAELYNPHIGYVGHNTSTIHEQLDSTQ
ncbi:CRISPR-associated helicase Cas3' [Corynebacterium sp. sy017]|uniref:CRISPR-associated helicase Cas3' n=1 Tax=unclassified Corynebacterium TaxID=2624378 RepID=UPI001185AD15|nr:MULTISPECIES: CRISPR-associated helicase Cas3' [unclassified Corynebacterium]MBP3088476.1 CRISPR-associated helicase Cas3' [Corynebacterium sp. sy017]TSD91784.1 CRISPR-associated helicase Cas3' [Corynebacterium sp. SY003]